MYQKAIELKTIVYKKKMLDVKLIALKFNRPKRNLNIKVIYLNDFELETFLNQVQLQIGFLKNTLELLHKFMRNVNV